MIDVLLPYWGDPALLRAAIKSVVAQTSSQWRLVVVDDATDDELLPGWLAALNDPRIRYLRNETRLGVCGNFRRCIELADAPHVVLMGCDDLLDARYIELVQLALERHPGVGMVQPRVRIIDSDGTEIAPLVDRVKRRLMPSASGDQILRGGDLMRHLLRGPWTYLPAICWRRDLLLTHPFRQDLETTLDLALLVDVVADGATFLLLEDIAFNYRRHRASASSVTAASLERFEEEKALFRETAARLDDLGWASGAREARRHFSSRLHALSRTPEVVLHGHFKAAAHLVSHAVSSGRTGPERGGLLSPSTDHSDTRGTAYAQRLVRLGGRRWKQVLDVQAPYRWNLRRHGLGRTLDVGCGVGRNLSALPIGSIGVDHNETSVDIARDRGFDALTVAEWLCRNTVEEAFDSVLVAHVLEHMHRSEALTLLKEYITSLKPGGNVLLICPQQRGFKSDSTHVEYFSRSDLEELAWEAGLVPLRSYSFPFPALTGRLFTYNESCVLARKPNVLDDRRGETPADSLTQTS